MTLADQKVAENIVQPECAKNWGYIMKLLFIVKVYK